MPTSNRPLLIAHRGDPSRAPENTLAGVRLALEAQPDLIEVDVHLSADGRVVVIHDATLERTTSGHGAVRDHTLAQLRRLDAGRWYSEEFTGEPLPTLEEVRAEAGQAARLAVELKAQGTGSVVGRWARGLTTAVPLFLSFRAQELRALKEEFPEGDIRLLAPEPRFAAADLDALIGLARGLGCRGLVVSGRRCPPESAARIHGEDLQVWVGAVNEPEDWERLLEAGCDGLITDCPLRLRSFLSDPPSKHG